MKKLLIIPIGIIIFIISIAGCERKYTNPDDYIMETLHGKVVDYDPPKHFYITYELSNGYKETEYISKHCSIKDNLIGADVTVIKMTHKMTSEVTYILQNTKSDFCS